jgi:mRNA-degrading endonuclease toxin of MazEF toxin-antitoxin module
MEVEPHRIRRGAVVIARVPEDPKGGRPAVVIRSNALAATPWVAVLPFTSDLDIDMPLWVRVEPTPGNGLLPRVVDCAANF